MPRAAIYMYVTVVFKVKQLVGIKNSAGCYGFRLKRCKLAAAGLDRDIGLFLGAACIID